MPEPMKYWAVVSQDCPLPISLDDVFLDKDDADHCAAHYRGFIVIPVAIVPWEDGYGTITRADVMRAARASTAKLKEIGVDRTMKEDGHEDR